MMMAAAMMAGIGPIYLVPWNRGLKTIAFLCRFFRPNSDVNISKTVYPIYLKIKVQRVPTSHSLHINF